MKRRPSSGLTLFWKILVIAWIDYFFVAVIYGAYKQMAGTAAYSGSQLADFLVFGLLSSAFMFIMLGSIKSVYIDGGGLFVSNYLKEIYIPFTDVRYVNDPDFTSHRRITIELKQTSLFGERITFVPPFFAAKSTTRELRELLNR